MSIEYRGETFSGYNKPKRTPKHPTKSHVVLVKIGSTIKMIRFGEQGASTAGKPKAGESEKMIKKRASFKARHGKNIAKGKSSAAYWSNKIKWQEVIVSLVENIRKKQKKAKKNPNVKMNSAKNSSITPKAYSDMRSGWQGDKGKK